MGASEIRREFMWEIRGSGGDDIIDGGSGVRDIMYQIGGFEGA